MILPVFAAAALHLASVPLSASVELLRFGAGVGGYVQDDDWSARSGTALVGWEPSWRLAPRFAFRVFVGGAMVKTTADMIVGNPEPTLPTPFPGLL